MKILLSKFRISFLLLIIPVMLLAAGCTYDDADESDPINNTDSVVFSHSLKGWELYSWTDNGTWHFSILIGTNRLKKYDEVISNKIQVTGTDSLILQLGKMPSGESILWVGSKWLQQNWGSQTGNLSLPEAGIVERISRFCLSKNILLTVAG